MEAEQSVHLAGAGAMKHASWGVKRLGSRARQVFGPLEHVCMLDLMRSQHHSSCLVWCFAVRVTGVQTAVQHV